MKQLKAYDFPHAIRIQPRYELAGVVRAMGDTEPAYAKVFDIFQRGQLKATAETWEQAQDMAFALMVPQRRD